MSRFRVAHGLLAATYSHLVAKLGCLVTDFVKP